MDSSICFEIVPSNLTVLKFYKNFATLISLLQEFGYETSDIQAALNADDCDSAFGLVRQQLVEYPNTLIRAAISYEYVSDYIHMRFWQRCYSSFETIIELMKHSNYNTRGIESLFNGGEPSLAWKMIYNRLTANPCETIKSTPAYQFLYELYGKQQWWSSSE